MKTRLVTLVLISIAFTGCVVTVDSEYATSAHWDDSDIEQIEVGETTKDWVIAAIGRPDSKRTRSDGTDVWRYKNVSERDTEVAVFLLFRFDVERQRHQNLQIEFENDVVTDYWLESDWID